MSWAPNAPDIIVDMIVYKITTDESNGERMNVYYSTSRSTIHNATKAEKERAL